MSQAKEAYLKQLQSSFQKFIFLQGNNNWITSSDTEDIKTAFKLANFIEKAAKHAKDGGFLDILLSELEKTQIVKQRCCEDTFLNAGDVLLQSFLSHRDVSEHKLDLAIRMFTSSFNGDRLENILSTVLLYHSSREAILDFALSNASFIDCDNLQHTLFLNKLTDLYRHEQNKIKEHIMIMVSNYKIEENLNLLIGILGLIVEDSMENAVRRLILDAILAKMYDRSVVSKPFWLCLFNKVNKKNLLRACENYKTFLEAFCRFIIYIGSMMEKKIVSDRIVWCSNSDFCICPEITYNDVVSLSKLLYNNTATQESLYSKIVEARQHAECSVWYVIEAELKNS